MAALSLPAPQKQRLRTKTGSRLSIIYVILVDLQALLGILTYAIIPIGKHPHPLHPLTMITAVIVIHIARKITAKYPSGRFTFILYVAAAVLILLGIGWAEMLPRG